MYIHRRGLFTAHFNWVSQYPGKYSKFTCNAATILNNVVVNFTKT